MMVRGSGEQHHQAVSKARSGCESA